MRFRKVDYRLVAVLAIIVVIAAFARMHRNSPDTFAALRASAVSDVTTCYPNPTGGHYTLQRKVVLKDVTAAQAKDLLANLVKSPNRWNEDTALVGGKIWPVGFTIDHRDELITIWMPHSKVRPDLQEVEVDSIRTLNLFQYWMHQLHGD